MATPGSASMAFGTAFGATILCRRPCRRKLYGNQRHLCTVRTDCWKFCSPKKTHENLAHVAAALPQVNQDHRIEEKTNEDVENGTQQLLKHESNGKGLSIHREHQTEHDVGGMSCILPRHM